MSTTADGAGGNGRLLSLDAFRGLTLAGMILVNNPGAWEKIYAPLKHAPWDGWTATDLVFPSFLFIAGVSIPIALGKRIERGDPPGALLAKVIRRSIIIFAIGLGLNMAWHHDLATVRIPGVLQRIALCYFAAALLYLKTGPRVQVLITAALLFGYWALMTLVPVPGHAPGDLSRPGNLAAYVDRGLMLGHLYKPDYDPEGLLSTLPAIATALLGVMAGRWLRTDRSPSDKAAGLMTAGTIAALIGGLWGLVFPINKALWTSSFVMLTAGLAAQWLGAFTWIIDAKGRRAWAAPFVIFGRNAIAAYVLSSLGGRVMTLINVAGAGGSRVNLKQFLMYHLIQVAPPSLASLLFALGYVLFWLLILSVLSWRKIYIRV